MANETETSSNVQDTAGMALLPPVDVREDTGGITLWADMPGVSKEGLDLQVEGDTLIIEGALAADTPANLTAVRAEVSLSRYRRVFTLSKELDPERISASLNRGVLEVRIPKAEHAQPRKIQVQVA